MDLEIREAAELDKLLDNWNIPQNKHSIMDCDIRDAPIFWSPIDI